MDEIRIADMTASSGITNNDYFVIDNSGSNGTKKFGAADYIANKEELVDIRVGANGETYASAGDAVRGQVSDLDNAAKFYYMEFQRISNGENTYTVNIPNNGYIKKMYVKNSSSSDGYVRYQFASEALTSTFLIEANSIKVIDIPSTAYGETVVINNMSSRVIDMSIYIIFPDVLNTIDNKIALKQNKKVFLIDDVSFSSNTETAYNVNVKSGVKKVLVLKNTGGSSAYFRVWFNAYYSFTELFNANEEKTFAIPDYIATTQMTFTSLNSKTFKVSLYYEVENIIDSIDTIDKTGVVTVDASGNGDFLNIESAIDFLTKSFDVANVPTTIYIKNGQYIVEPKNNAYYSAIQKGVNKISIIGESREGVKIQCTNTSTMQNKVLNVGGECIIKNLSIYCLRDESYTQSADLGHNCYCIHVDDGTLESPYNTVIENCYFYSECASPIGAGLRKNQRQIYRNVVSESNGIMSYSAFYIHAPQQGTWTGCSIVLDNVTGITKDGGFAIALSDVTGSIPYSEIPTTIRRSIFITNGSETGAENFKTRHLLTEDSQLNNISELNY